MIQGLLGHSDISITLRTYSHLLPSMQQEVVQTWNDVFGEGDEEHTSGNKREEWLLPTLGACSVGFAD